MAYQFDHQWEQERARLAALEAVFDPHTKKSLRSSGLAAGWRCLEVGAGGGSIAEWLCEVVGPDGRVVATDVETKFLEAIESSSLEIRHHDIICDPLESASFDLIHSRAVLGHLPERDEIVHRLLEALKPGGWLCLDGADFSTVRAVAASPADAAFFDSAFAAVTDAARVTGFDPWYGRRLGVVFRGLGLEDVALEGAVFEWHGQHPFAQLYSMTFERLRPLVIEQGALDDDDYDRLLNLITAPDFFGTSNALFMARGRKVAV